ncbi:beta-lactamase [Azorhizobium oxalatiphilum]|uniref:Beta-lactamase n=1 Tax=Azorhizobium oxalatiphilum TaxID=980631 RepID=A0A917BH37_9HYPH|nr:class A beta-lactamase [Azorhizobium oxalatiphilum]GGF45210.1 beta-lactamase [Azorhizobium oxalatiphilum]
MLSRRRMMLTLAAASAAPLASFSLSGRALALEPAKPFGGSALAEGITALEAKSGGRLGVAVRDTGNGARFAHRGGTRFPMCSTFKFLLAAAVLERVDGGKMQLATLLPIRPVDVIDYSPMVEKNVGTGASVEALCAATMTLSDNGAANLLLAAIGGPKAVTAFARRLGDPVTRLDRTEPALNVVPPGETLDTTTPDAMADDLEKLVLGDGLKAGSRALLTQWLLDCKTGDKRLRAGLPSGWKVGDKTGTGPKRTGTANDIAVLWPPGRAPLIVTSYLTASKLDGAGNDAIHADVARLVAGAV